MLLSYHTLDVFTHRGMGGNPLAVVHDADDLAADKMQRIARKFNLSETVFVSKPESPAHTARVRIFTPTQELLFAGHPTIGTAVLLAELRTPEVNGEIDAIVALEEAIGTVRVGVRGRAGNDAFGEFDAPKLPAEAGTLPVRDRLAAAVGLIPSEIGFENHKPTRFAAGNTFAFIPVATIEAMGNAQVNAVQWRAVFAGQDVAGAYLYTRQCVRSTSAFHARMFAPDLGVPEDPATGSAAVAFAGVVHHFDALPDGMHRRIIEQGFEMGRPSAITLTLVVSRGRLDTVRIGGHAVRMSEGTLTV